MNDCVAIWANWPKVFDRVDNVGRADTSERNNMMDMNKVLSTFAILCLEVEAANKTRVTVAVNARLPSRGATLISVYGYLSLSAFNDRIGNFIGVRHVKQTASR